MWTDKALLKLSDKKVYSREELFHVFSCEKSELRDAAFRWTLYKLLQEQKIFKMDYDAYSKDKPQILPKYEPYYSDKAKTLNDMLANRFPKINFVIFESVLLNEFLNHQIAGNTLYLQIEKDVSSYAFDVLQEEYAGSVLYKPGKKEFDRYWTRECIVVLDLVTQAPLSQEKPHEITIEKMLVDIIAEKSVTATFSPAEISFVYENAMESYQVDMRKLNRYAGRRGKTSLIKKYLGDRD